MLRVGRDCKPQVPCPDSDVAEGPLNISQHCLTAESPARTSVPVVGIVIGFFLLLTVAAGGTLLWRRMRKGLPGMVQEEGGASERGVETPSKIGRLIPAGTEGDRDPERDGEKENWRGERDSGG